MRIKEVTNFFVFDFGQNKCATIGFFDGMHTGHQQLITRMVEFAKKNNLTSTVITFDSKPKVNACAQLIPLDEKLKLIENMGVDLTLVLKTEKIKVHTAQQFIAYMQALKIKHLFVGSDIRFGYGGVGDIDMLKEKFVIMEEDFIMDLEEKVSSSTIRRLLLLGSLNRANELLGYNYYIKGVVIDGKKNGREIGFPTANIRTSFLVIARGTYLTKTTIGRKKYYSLTNVGLNPTFGVNELSVETYIDSYSGNIYGEEICVEFVERIRDEQKFDSVDKLIEQINKDLMYLKSKEY